VAEIKATSLQAHLSFYIRHPEKEIGEALDTYWK
jgi:hypothetical protein